MSKPTAGVQLRICRLCAATSVLVSCVILAWTGVPTQVSAESGTTDNTNESDKNLLTFAVMGDVPLTPQEYALLERQIAEIPKNAEFVFHVGDIKHGVPPCTEDIYQRVATVLAASKNPLFIIPGDNEWNDCKKPDEAWKYWSKHFQKFDKRWPHMFPVQRQQERNENFSFRHRKVLFIGFNLVGGRVHDVEEWATRQNQNVDWLHRQLDDSSTKVDRVVILAHAFPNSHNRGIFREGLISQLKAYGKPVLYLQGDGHVWKKDRPFKEAQNILRILVDQGGVASPLLVTISADDTEPFIFDRRRRTSE